MTPEYAAELCAENAHLADGFDARVGIGVGSGGPKVRTGVTISNAIANPQSEEEFMSACIQRKLRGEPEPPTFRVRLGRGF